MVQEAQTQKTLTQRFVESWQQPYVIGVFAAAIMVFVGARVIHTVNWYDAFYHAMVIARADAGDSLSSCCINCAFANLNYAIWRAEQWFIVKSAR